MVRGEVVLTRTHVDAAEYVRNVTLASGQLPPPPGSTGEKKQQMLLFKLAAAGIFHFCSLLKLAAKCQSCSFLLDTQEHYSCSHL